MALSQFFNAVSHNLRVLRSVTIATGATVTGLTKSHVGLSNVDNTSDVNKPVSSATTTALAAKLTATKGAAVTNATVAADGTSAGTQLNALLASLRAANIIN